VVRGAPRVFGVWRRSARWDRLAVLDRPACSTGGCALMSAVLPDRGGGTFDRGSVGSGGGVSAWFGERFGCSGCDGRPGTTGSPCSTGRRARPAGVLDRPACLDVGGAPGSGWRHLRQGEHRRGRRCVGVFRGAPRVFGVWRSAWRDRLAVLDRPACSTGGCALMSAVLPEGASCTFDRGSIGGGGGVSAWFGERLGCSGCGGRPGTTGSRCSTGRRARPARVCLDVGGAPGSGWRHLRQGERRRGRRCLGVVRGALRVFGV